MRFATEFASFELQLKRKSLLKTAPAKVQMLILRMREELLSGLRELVFPVCRIRVYSSILAKILCASAYLWPNSRTAFYLKRRSIMSDCLPNSTIDGVQLNSLLTTSNMYPSMRRRRIFKTVWLLRHQGQLFIFLSPFILYTYIYKYQPINSNILMSIEASPPWALPERHRGALSMQVRRHPKTHRLKKSKKVTIAYSVSVSFRWFFSSY